MDNIDVRLTGVSKKYILHHDKPTLVENMLKRSRGEEFWALKDIDLIVGRGERVGIIGPNGSGKTTLLEIIAGITTPTEGNVEVLAKPVSLIELEAGFHSELTGEENIFLNGMLVGMSKEEIRKKIKKIIAFSGIEQFIDTPFYTYSQGMKLRLSFSIVSHTNPDIIIFDENISVGDEDFRKKCFKKLEEFCSRKKTMLFVSHDLRFVKSICSRIVWLDKGRVKKIGNTDLLKEYSGG